jgi:chemotaxis protein CheX
MSAASVGTVVAVEWLPRVEESIHEVFTIMLESQLQKGVPSLFPAPECTAMVAFTGSLRGILSIRCGGSTANQIAGILLKLPPQHAAQYAADGLGELANMIAGNFKNKIDGLANRILLSVPTVVMGITYTCRSLSNARPLELWFSFQELPLQVTLQVNS